MAVPLPLLFGVTSFLGAALLFAVQPLVAKMLLPQLGGSPAVWNTCLVFYQVVLLAGYAAAHVLAREPHGRRQLTVFVALLLAGGMFLPVNLAANALESPPWESSPVIWQLRQLLAGVAAPFFALSLTSPLLQRWFSRGDHPQAHDPYFLYAAGNAGSLLALVSYPVAVEPWLGVVDQSRVWAAGFGALVLLVLACGWRVFRPGAGNDRARAEPPAREARAVELEPVTIRRRLGWVTCAVIPSSLLLGVTQYLTTDIASVPLLWIAPLALYLGSFVLVFARRPVVPRAWFRRALPVLAVAVLFLMLQGATEPLAIIAGVQLAFFLTAAICWHGALADSRPGPRQLTEFYLWMSVGGALGGVFNALVAPVIFTEVWEYPLMLLAACCAPMARGGKLPAGDDKLSIGPAWAGVAVWLALLGQTWMFFRVAAPALPAQSVLRPALLFGLPLLTCFLFSRQRWTFVAGLTGVCALALPHANPFGEAMVVERNFFGVTRVVFDQASQQKRLIHGRTHHGGQFLPGERHCEPLAFYHRSGPVADLIGAVRSGPEGIGVIGLGSGAMAAYARPGEAWTFYEIDPTVTRLAREARYFSFLTKCSRGHTTILEGDARLRLQAGGGPFRMLVVDAFSSDAIPAHLVTREALRLYLERLAPGGLLAFHISNRYLDLEPMLAAQARDADLVARIRRDQIRSAEELADGIYPSDWLVMARAEADLGSLLQDGRWLEPRTRDGVRLWTDDYSALAPLLMW